MSETDLISRQAALDALNQIKIYRPLDSDRWVISDCLNKIVNLPSAQPENNIVSNSGREPTKNDIIMLYHKVYGCTIINAEQAHEKALEYLRDKAMLKG